MNIDRCVTAVLAPLVLSILPGLASAANRPETPTMPLKYSEAREGAFRADPQTRLLAGASLQATPEILKPLEARTGLTSSTTQPGASVSGTPYMLIGLPDDHPLLHELAATVKKHAPAGSQGDEGYAIDITPDRVLLTARKPAGLLYGVRALAESGGPDDQAWQAKALRGADWPALRWRGMHVFLGSRAGLPDAERLLTEELPRLRMNQLILEINYGFQFRSHPEVAEANGLTVDDARRLADLARASHIRLIPMINCLGHQSWAQTTNKLLKAHPEFDETPELPANNPGIYCRSWCPLHPDVNKVVFALFDELIDAFHADAFHVGLDEVFILGRCPRCKGKDPAALFAKAVNDYHAHLVGKRHVQMMMWGDRLLDSKTTPYGEWEASANGTAPAIDRIPRDIVLCDWHYENTPEFPSVAYFQEKGFPVYPSGWNVVANATQLAKVTLQHRSEKMVGYLATTWEDASSVARGLAGTQKIREEKERADLIGAIRAAARLAWDGP